VRVLLPEPTFKGSYVQLSPRAAVETAVRLACVETDAPVEMLHRNTARSRLGMDRKGPMEKQIPAIVGEPTGKYWTAGRNLAAVAALADE
jgi:hypothetical protein